MDNRTRYEKLLKLLSTKKLLKNDPYGIAVYVERLREELSHPTLANNTINNLLDKIIHDGRLPEETRRIFDEIRSDFGAQESETGKYAKAEIWDSSSKLWPYK